MIRFLRFGLVSTLGAGIDFVLVLVLLRAGLGAAPALAAAMTVSATVVYVIHQKLTFGDLGERALSTHRLGAFLLNTAAIYLMRLVIFEGLISFGLKEALALAAALVASVVLNYTVSRLLIFASRVSEKDRK